MHADNDTDGPIKMSIDKKLDIILQEIVDVRNELKQDIANLDQKLSRQISAVATDLKAVKTNLHTLRSEVHDNQSTFMHNHELLELRVAILEAKV